MLKKLKYRCPGQSGDGADVVGAFDPGYADPKECRRSFQGSEGCSRYVNGATMVGYDSS